MDAGPPPEAWQEEVARLWSEACVAALDLRALGTVGGRPRSGR